YNGSCLTGHHGTGSQMVSTIICNGSVRIFLCDYFIIDLIKCRILRRAVGCLFYCLVSIIRRVNCFLQNTITVLFLDNSVPVVVITIFCNELTIAAGFYLLKLICLIVNVAFCPIGRHITITIIGVGNSSERGSNTRGKEKGG